MNYRKVVTLTQISIRDSNHPSVSVVILKDTILYGYPHRGVLNKVVDESGKRMTVDYTTMADIEKPLCYTPPLIKAIAAAIPDGTAITGDAALVLCGELTSCDSLELILLTEVSTGWIDNWELKCEHGNITWREHSIVQLPYGMPIELVRVDHVLFETPKSIRNRLANTIVGSSRIPII